MKWECEQEDQKCCHQLMKIIPPTSSYELKKMIMGMKNRQAAGTDLL
jgi:hypothetical protein